MYGTREELCTRLENMFTPDEPLVLLVWTEEAFYVACGELDVKPEPGEIQGLMETTGNTDMAVYRREGVTNSGVCDLLVRHCEARGKRSRGAAHARTAATGRRPGKSCRAGMGGGSTRA